MSEHQSRDERQSRIRPVQLPISERRVLLGLGDLVAINLAVLIALRVWAFVGRRVFDAGFILPQAGWFVTLSALWLFLASANDFYNLALTARPARSQARLIQITLQLLIVYLVIFFLSPRESLPRLFILYYAIASYVLIALWRLARPFLIGWRPLRRRVLVVGTGWPARAIIDAIHQHAPADYEVAGIVDEGSPVRQEELVIDADVIGYGPDLARIAAELGAVEIILATSGTMEGGLFQAVMDCYERGISIRPMPLLYEQLTGRVPIEHVGGNWNVVLPLEGQSPFNPYPIIKRLMDISLSLIGLAALVLLLPLLTVLIFLDSPGPIFYAQERVGKAGRVFRLIKLRSMLPEAESQHGPLWAVTNDARVTRVGRFLRRSRLDELPQLLNVLKGEMSLIGPRPERPYFVEHLQQTIPFYRTRLAVKPGLTGWAQVNYGYGSTERDALIKLQYDLYYVRHQSLLLDALILLRTIGYVVRLQGT